MTRFLELIGGDEVETDEQWRILGVLFDVKPVIIASAAISMASAVGWQQGLTGWAALWSVSAWILVSARFALSRAYRKRAATDSLDRWRKLHAVGSILTGLQWGMGGVAFMLTDDSGVLSCMFTVSATIMIGASARGCCFPSSTKMQVGITAMLLFVFSALSGHWMFAALMLLSIVYQVSFINSLGSVNLKQILSEQQRKSLLASLERRNAEIAAANVRLHDISMTDGLTGISNRRCFNLDVEASWAHASERNEPLALLFIDVDHFKRFNDTHGHLVGDQCLVLVAAAIDSVVRVRSDRAYRYGGEEFAVMLEETDLAEAGAVANRIVEAVRNIAVPIGADQFGVTVSIGIASLIPKPDMTPATLLTLADQSVYLAKQDGRNCVRHGSPDPSGSVSDAEPTSIVPTLDKAKAPMVKCFDQAFAAD